MELKKNIFVYVFLNRNSFQGNFNGRDFIFSLVKYEELKKKVFLRGERNACLCFSYY